MNHQVSNIEIKVVKGTILPEENELGSEYSLFYWANFVPHYDGKMIFIIGECGFNEISEKKRFIFKYNSETDIMTFCEKYRTCLCEPEICNKYYLNISKKDDERMIAIPWIKLSSKSGVAVPQLVERIFGKIPETMVFI
jgi:hypothetical protein